MTRVRAIRRGRACATELLKRRTACDPPKISSKLSFCGIPSEPRASARLVARGSRIGVPVTKHGRRCPRVEQVSANVTAMALASRDVTRTLRPGTTLPSHMTTGIRKTAAASITGMATYPPVVKIALGRQAIRRAMACGTDRASRIGSSTAWTFRSTVRSERSSKRWSGIPDAGTTCASRPRWPPTQRSSGEVGVACSDRATARAG